MQTVFVFFVRVKNGLIISSPESYSQNLSVTVTLKNSNKLVFKTNYRVMQVKYIAECSPLELSAIRLTFIKLQFVIKTFVLSVYESYFFHSQVLL